MNARLCLPTLALVLLQPSLSAAATTRVAVDPTFTELAAAWPDVETGAVAWGDYDNDGDLDLAIAGSTSTGPVTRIYRNTAGSFADVSAGLPGVYYCALAWGDFDGDGDLDLLVSGETGGGAITRVYRNTAGSFADVAVGLPGLFFCAAAWGDYDNDGDLDLALAGETGAGAVARVYRNTAGSFADAGLVLTGVSFCALAWGDYDKDGDLDLALSGQTSGGGAATQVYRNTAGGLADAAAGLPGLMFSALAWGDVDNDGDLDLALSGDTGGGAVARVYRNNGASFADMSLGLAGIAFGSLAWGDIDNDGDVDLAVAGDAGGAGLSRVYKNNGASFADLGAGLPGLAYAALAWGDFDNDGDLDLLLSGDAAGLPYAHAWRNNSLVANAAPSAPSGLSISSTSTTVTFQWLASSDPNGPATGLSYNLRIGIAPGGGEIVPGMAAANGWRRVPRIGNAGSRLQWSIKKSSLPTAYYWGVQAVDPAFAGSSFAAAPAVAVDEAPAPSWTARPARPNPFRASTVIRFALSSAAPVTLGVFDAAGRRVRSLVGGTLPAGVHDATWDGRDDAGRRMPAGLYLYRLRAGERAASGAMSMLE